MDLSQRLGEALGQRQWGDPLERKMAVCGRSVCAGLCWTEDDQMGRVACLLRSDFGRRVARKRTGEYPDREIPHTLKRPAERTHYGSAHPPPLVRFTKKENP